MLSSVMLGSHDISRNEYFAYLYKFGTYYFIKFTEHKNNKMNIPCLDYYTF